MGFPGRFAQGESDQGGRDDAGQRSQIKTLAPAPCVGDPHQHQRRHKGTQQVRPQILSDAHRHTAPRGRHFLDDHRMADRHDPAFGHAHQQACGKQHHETARRARYERAQAKGKAGPDDDDLLLAHPVRQAAHHKSGNRPCQRQRAGKQADGLVAETQIVLDKRHQEIGSVPVEKDDAEIEAEQPHHPDLIGRAAPCGGIGIGRAHAKGLTRSEPSQFRAAA